MKKAISTILTLSIVFAMSTASFGITIPTPTNSSTLKTPIQKVLGVVQSIAVAFAVGMLLYLGIKYAMASANEKADVKNASIKYVIGAVLILGSSGVLSIIQKLTSEVAQQGK